MDEHQKETLRKHITQRLEELAEDVRRYEEASAPVSPDSSIGRLTRMDAIGSRSMNQAALEKARHNVRRLERALTLLDDPDFGMCEDCGEPIAPGRLKIMPEAALCVGCAQRLE